MKSWYHSWVAAIRIARRDAWRSKGRSLLVLSMIALPILGVSAADLTLRSAELTTEQRMDRTLGRADAKLMGSGLGAAPLLQSPTGDNYAPVGGYQDGRVRSAPDSANHMATAVPAGTESVKDSSGHARMRTRHGILDTQVRELDTRSRLVEGLITLDRGRLPERAGEVAATTNFLESSGLYVGSTVVARGAEQLKFKIVGAYELPGDLNADQLLAPPGTLLTPLDRALVAGGFQGVPVEDVHLVKLAGGDGFTWNMVKQANTKGVLVISRAVVLDPPADSEVPLYKQEPQRNFGGSAAYEAAALAAAATVVGLAMLEVCLLAGPAFAVGARRSRRQLGLVGANGGDRRHIRAIVLSGGLVIGAAAAVIGSVLGILLTIVLRPVLEEQLGERFPGLDFRPLELLGIALLAVLTGLLAAIAPAVTASRQTVLASLTGRRGVRRANRVLPVLGLIAVAAGAAIALYGAVADMGFVVVAAGSALAELGLVALTPVLVGLFGRAGRWLPLSPRLALRDAVRNRGRTAPAVAAVLAAVAGTVAVATFQQSQEAKERHEYTASLPYGVGSMTSDQAGGFQTVPAVRQALSRELPVGVRADTDRIVVGRPGCDRYSEDRGCGRAEVIVPKDQRCPLWESDDPDSLGPEKIRQLRQDWRCKDQQRYNEYGVLVADEKLLTALAVDDPASVGALKAGKPVSFNRQQVKDGKLTIRLITDMDKAEEAGSRGEDPPGQDKVFAVHQAPESAESYGIDLVLPPAAAKAAGLRTAPYGAYFTLDGEAGTEQRQRLDGEIDRLGAEVSVHIEKGYQGGDSLTLLALSLFAGLVTIGAAGIATGLAQADAEADLKTLAAVGAPPRVRRTLSGFQCGVVAAMGVVLGSAAGVLPAIGLKLTERREQLSFWEEAVAGGWGVATPKPFVPIVIPWETLAGLLVLVPVGAALLAALVTRSSGALARRAAG
ncbi:FtsX-like permease family protein [Streptomyces sp. NPDC012888]|uniref:FtsX-like permease family protein n=1 Tax=Streptomyces sp. NPDC012888 TaxID=3364855 RepID=UPI003678292B